jgi:hypothetical protein
MRWFKRWYGANPLHLLAMLGCITLTGYAAGGLLQVKPVAVLIWFSGAVVGHDLILVPLYVLADRSVMTVFRHRPPRLPAVPWINYLRVPAALSGMLLLIWFPLIFRIPSRFPSTTDLSLNPYLGHWLAVTGALFLLSAAAFALRLRLGRRPRELREARETREAKEAQEAYEFWGAQKAQQAHEPWQAQEVWAPWESAEPVDTGQPRDPRDPREPREPRQSYPAHRARHTHGTYQDQGTYEPRRPQGARGTAGQQAVPRGPTGPNQMWPPQG